MRPQNKVTGKLAKKAYAAPRLTVHGTMEKITKAKRAGSKDSMMSQMPK